MKDETCRNDNISYSGQSDSQPPTNHQMRITPEQHKKALATIENTFGKNTKTWLFGSRAYDDKRGGDVDIFAEAAKIPSQGKTLSEIETGAALEAIFDNGSVDLLVTYPGEQLKAIHKIAKKTGVIL